jgi:hypothetical protein
VRAAKQLPGVTLEKFCVGSLCPARGGGILNWVNVGFKRCRVRAITHGESVRERRGRVELS